jgi:hypothetical protein
MLLRKWTTDTPTPHVVRLDARRFANEITVSVDGVVVHCRLAPFGFHAGFRHDLLIDGASWTVFVGTGILGLGCELVRTKHAPHAFKRWRRTGYLRRICLSLSLIVLAHSHALSTISSRLGFDEQFGTFLSQALLAIGVFGVFLNVFRWWMAGRRNNVTSTTGATSQAPNISAHSVFRCLALLVISIALSIAAFNAKSIAMYFVGNREMIPVLTAVLTALSAVFLGVAVTIALYPLGNVDSRGANGDRAGIRSLEQRLGARPRPGSFFRPFLEDIRRTARRWKLGLPRFWIRRARTPR